MLIYIIDIAYNTDVQMKIYAEDCVIYTITSDKRGQLRLNRPLQAIQEWSSAGKTDINYYKTVVMSVACKKPPIHFAYNLDGNAIRRVNEYKYFGITFSLQLLEI